MIRLKNIVSKGKLSAITSKAKWQEAIAKLTAYDFYHTYDYHELSKLPGEKQLLLHYQEGYKIICLPLIIRKIDATEYYDATSVYGYAGPLEKNIDDGFDNKDYIRSLTSFFAENKIITVFSRLNPFIDQQRTILKGIGKIIPLGKVVNIDLTKSKDDQRVGFSKTTKRYLNKARRKFHIKNTSTTKDILAFKKLYYENMAKF